MSAALLLGLAGDDNVRPFVAPTVTAYQRETFGCLEFDAARRRARFTWGRATWSPAGERWQLEVAIGELHVEVLVDAVPSQRLLHDLVTGMRAVVTLDDEARRALADALDHPDVVILSTRP